MTNMTDLHQFRVRTPSFLISAQVSSEVSVLTRVSRFALLTICKVACDQVVLGQLKIVCSNFFVTYFLK